MKSTVGKVSAIMIMVTFLLASAFALNVVLAENSTIEMNITGFAIANNTTLDNFTENFTTNSSIETNMTLESNATSNNTNTTYVLENVTEESASVSDGFVLGESLAFGDSVTVAMVSNETNTTENETSSQTNETTVEINETKEEIKPTFDLQLSYPDRITRGETIEISATLTSDVFAKGVYLKWLLPMGFEIVSGNAIEDCGNLDGNACIANISVMTSNANIGLGDLRIVVDYEE